ncbi:MAG: hypothetical protein WD073_00600 [Xanthobacteraceae bacterium]
MGTPAASNSTLVPGAGHGDEGDASFQGPAQEQIETLPEQPKPTHAEVAVSDDAPGSVIELHTAKSAAADTTPVTRAASGLVTTRPKPAKRLNAKERAKAKFKTKSAEDGTRPDMTAKAKSKAEKAKVKATR